MNYINEYKSKLKTPAEAVKIVKNGDWIDYGAFHNFPHLLDKALADRKEELKDVKIRGNLIPFTIQVAECDPSREHFFYTTWHCSAYERKLIERGLCNFTPMVYRNLHSYYRNYLNVNVAMFSAAPMDKHGYFNLSCTSGALGAILEITDKVIIEVNENLPRVYGGGGEVIHISDVDIVIEGEHGPLAEVPTPVPSIEEIAIAEHILPHITDGATLQLGIGGLPDVLGSKIAESDVKDLGMHTELCSNAYYTLHKAGKLTNKKKTYKRGKGMFGLASGTKEFYEWIDNNPGLEACQLDIINDPSVIAQNDNLISINSCVAFDLFGGISSETSNLRQISGTGGQLDFVTGAVMSKGGKSFIATTSTHKDKTGKIHSRIHPYFTGGDVITVPRSQANYIVTEYGAVNLTGQSTWARAERIISIAHPDFRSELEKEAEKMGIWKKSNKR